MTSWISSTRRKPGTVTREQAYTFETNDSSGFCTQFNQYLYAYLTAKSKSRNLYVFDKKNAVNSSLSLLQSTFEIPEEIKFSDMAMLQYQRLTMEQTFPITRTIPIQTIKQMAKDLFNYNDETLLECDKFLKLYKLPKSFDVGVHIRAGDKLARREMTPIPIESYVSALKAYQKLKDLKEMNVFVMTDTYKLFEQLKAKADSSWKLYTLDTQEQKGYDHSEFKQLPPRQRKAAYIQFLTELQIMRQLDGIICTLTSNVGRWLYINMKEGAQFKSLDLPTYSTT